MLFPFGGTHLLPGQAVHLLLDETETTVWAG